LLKKATTYAQDFQSAGDALEGINGKPNGTTKIDVDGVVDLYESYIIPLTKEVEVEYLLHRLDSLSEVEVEQLAKSKG